MNKKVGILTFHSAHNYGAVLQAYALQKFIENLGYNVEIIDYRPKYITKNYTLNINYENYFGFVKSLIKRMIYHKKRKKRFDNFSYFIEKKLKLSKKLYTNDSFKDDYDIFILGSDQIWNGGITNNDPIFFGDFNTGTEVKKITYAASTEAKLLNEIINKDFFKEKIKNFAAISVREDSLAKILQPLTDLKIVHVLDPVLLVSPEVFNPLIIHPQINYKYILIYQVILDKKVNEIANEIGRKDNLGIINLIPRVEIRDINNKYATASPEEFVSLINYADFIVTTSFHGVAFSIAMKKQFVYVSNENRGRNRVFSLLEKLKLQNRIIYDIQNIPKTVIDYSEISNYLNREKTMSKDFLNQELM